MSFLLLFSLNAQAALSDITAIYKKAPALDGFDVCIGGGCAEVKHVFLDDEEWQKIKDVFWDNDDTLDAEGERRLIAEAIGELEKIIGEKTGTSGDRAGTFGNSEFSGQLDCNDEAINTTSYIRLMQQAGLIRFHEVEDMRTRNFFFSGWPHSTAVIHEIAANERYAVDSWFFDNGEPATIVPFALWKSGYIPEDSLLATSGRTAKNAQ